MSLRLMGLSCNPAFPLLLAAVGLFSPDNLHGDDGKSTGYQCTVSTVVCGSVVTTATETEICGVVELVDIGKLSDKTYTEVTFFAGYRIGTEVLIIGGGSAKGGMKISCKIPWDGKKKTPDYEQLKKELPQLLKDNAVIKEKFPKVSKIELDKNFKFDTLKTAEVEAVKKAYPANK